MSLSDEVEAYFEATKAPILVDSLRFKSKLGIGEKAYALLRQRENLTTFTEAIGVGSAASGVAASSVVATTFFSTSGGVFGSAMSAIGLGTAAVTPIGWVIAAGVVAGGSYIGVSRLLEKPKDNGLIVIPKYINTPLDTIAVAVIELMLPLALKVANSGGLGQAERTVIARHFVEKWGYDKGFVDRLIAQYACELNEVRFTDLSQALVNYVKDSPDCDQDTVLADFLNLLSEIVEADGVIDEHELAALQFVRDQLATEAKQAGLANTVVKNIRQGSTVAVTTATSAGSKALDSSRSGAKRLGGSIAKLVKHRSTDTSS